MTRRLFAHRHHGQGWVTAALSLRGATGLLGDDLFLAGEQSATFGFARSIVTQSVNREGPAPGQM